MCNARRAHHNYSILFLFSLTQLRLPFLVEALNWLGIDWDEGIDVGGPNEPYRQSQRSDIYLDVV